MQIEGINISKSSNMGINNSTKVIFGDKMLGWLAVLLIALLLAICVFITWACSYVHWILAAIVGCLFGAIWVFTAAVGVRSYQKIKR